VATRFAELAAIGALATALTVAIALPVLRSPTERLFGAESVGRHHDPFTAMERFADDGSSASLYTQPVTDRVGAWLTLINGPVTAFNVLILTSFPLSAVAAYLLARHLAISRGGATVAALAFAFSPFHVAHAAYHPHIAQTQWIPLYLLVLWRCLDVASPLAMALLVAGAAAVVLSNFYGGLIMATLTPPAAGAYWFVRNRRYPDAPRRLLLTALVLLGVVASGAAYVAYQAPEVFTAPSAFAFPRADLFLYSANWRSYLVPPAVHPLMGTAVSAFWTRSGVSVGLLEQQVSLGLGIVALGGAAGFGWWRHRVRIQALWAVPILAGLALVAFLCSLPPEGRFWGGEITRPSAWLYDIVPMFRAYARFGVVVQLMAALLAGCGVSYLWRTGARWPRTACVALVALASVEYAVPLHGLSRDVLPTTSHRWVMNQPGYVRVFDCTPLDVQSAAVPWLTRSRVLVGDASSDCTEPHLSDRLVAGGFTHLLVRRNTADGAWMLARATDDLRVVDDRLDGRVFALGGTAPRVYAAGMRGFFPREHDDSWSWRWMGQSAALTLVNAGTSGATVAFDLEMSAFEWPRVLQITLGGRPIQKIVATVGRRLHRLGPLPLEPGSNVLTLEALTPATAPSDVMGTDDLRPLSVAVGTWEWTPWGDTP
jgi:hypothetical protein